MMGVSIHPVRMKMVYKYKYEKRLIYLVSRVVACCGEISRTERVCPSCQIKIKKCARLVKRGQMPLTYYIELIRALMVNAEKSDYDN